MKELIAYAEEEYYGRLEMYDIHDEYSQTYSVEFCEDHMCMESNELDEEHTYTRLVPAYDMFKQLLKTHKLQKVYLREDFEDRYADILDPDPYYTRSATAGDYSPSCPWNAPGMSIRDFI